MSPEWLETSLEELIILMAILAVHAGQIVGLGFILLGCTATLLWIIDRLAMMMLRRAREFTTFIAFVKHRREFKAWRRERDANKKSL